MEKLSTRLNFWSFLVTVTVILNSFLGVYALKELRSTDRILAQVNEVDSRIRKLRESFFQYHHYALIAEITRDGDDITARNESKKTLLRSLNEGLGEKLDSKLSEDFAIEKDLISPMLLKPNPGKVSQFDKTTFLSRTYRSEFSAAFNQMEQISNRSSQIVRLEEIRNEEFYRRCIVLNLSFLACSLLLLAVVNLFFRKKVINPMINVIEVAKKIKSGDLSARVHIYGNDEFSEMGKNLNEAIYELQLRREERVKFIGSVAHDIKNPLSAISLSCDLALQKRSDDFNEAAQAKIFGIMKSQVDRIKQMTDDLLEAAKNGMPRWSISSSKVLLDEILHEAIEIFPEESKKNLILIEETHGLQIVGDRSRLIQVMTNLISNALKYSPARSVIELVCGRSKEFAFIEVRDHGLGIPEKQKEIIFAPFKRLDEGKRFAPGTGLGLTIVKEIIESHHGSISVHSQASGGTIFRIELPLDLENGSSIVQTKNLKLDPIV